MSEVRIDQKLVVPLFGIEVETALHLRISDSEFVDRMIAHLFQEPVLLNAVLKDLSKRETIAVPVPIPSTVIHICPWSDNPDVRDQARNLVPIDVLPRNFDSFDNLGPVAFRAGRGGLGGFQTVTTVSTKMTARSLLMIVFDQMYTDTKMQAISDSNPYESRLVDSFLDGIRLSLGGEPHPHKGFHIADGQLSDIVTKWPLTEIQDQPIEVYDSQLASMKNAFLQVWKVRVGARQSTSCKILTLALEYYYFASTMTETRTIFLFLMIAFEALFKFPTERSASHACSRLGKLISRSKDECREIRRFMWGAKETPGCCQLRNQLVHGGISGLRPEVYRQLRVYLRLALANLVFLVVSGKIGRESYYESVTDFVERRFQGLPSFQSGHGEA